MKVKSEGEVAQSCINISDIELLRYCPDGIPASEIEAAEGASSRINVTDNSSLHLPHAEIRVACSKGTYIRALARDLGEALCTGAHLDSLCRTKNGGFRVEDALTVEQAVALLAGN